MKIRETYKSFTREGYFAFFITLSDEGVEYLDELMLQQIIVFSNVVFQGDIKSQNSDLKNLLKKARKKNEDTIFHFYCNGQEKLVGGISNVKYSINFNISIDKIKYNVLNWFNECDSKFYFNVNNSDDVEKVYMLVNDLGIKKNNIYLTKKEAITNDDLKFLLTQAQYYGYNVEINANKLFWNNLGRGDEQNDD